MAEPRHRPPGDDTFLTSLGRHVAAAAGVVAVMAAAFWAVGSIDDADGDLVVADSPTDTSPDTTTPPSDVGTGDGTPSPTASDSPSPSASPTDAEGTTDEQTTPAETETIPPSEISVQVLDAVRLDGNTATDEIAEQLEADGYDVVTVQEAVRVYDVTTVFYTAGFEESARQVAARYGFTRVEEKPDNLSDTVRVHLVVGRDRA